MQRHLIIVDEDKSLAHGIALALRFDFERISIVQSPLSIRDIIQDSSNTVIISEIRFSTVDGTEKIIELKESFPEIPIIVFSAYFSGKILGNLKKAGVSTILEKPIQMEKLRKELKKE